MNNAPLTVPISIGFSVVIDRVHGHWKVVRMTTTTITFQRGSETTVGEYNDQTVTYYRASRPRLRRAMCLDNGVEVIDPLCPRPDAAALPVSFTGIDRWHASEAE